MRRSRDGSSGHRGWRSSWRDSGGRPVFVYIGTNQARRGYDSLLRLAVAEEDAFCIAAAGSKVRRIGSTSTRFVANLRARGALLEMDGYYRCDATVDLFLNRAEVVVLPHRDHLGSSGVMLQALAAGRPVLVPDRGLMAHRVRTHSLGRTYRHEDWDDLQRQYRLLRRAGDEAGFTTSIESFMGFVLTGADRERGAARHGLRRHAGEACPSPLRERDGDDS